MKDCLIALDIGGTFLKSCLFDMAGDLVPDSFDSEPVDSDGELRQVKASYQTLLRRQKNHAMHYGFRVAAVAADTPGPFDYFSAVSHMTHKYTAIYGVPLRPWFYEILGEIPVCFLHDSSAFLYGAMAGHPEVRNAAGVMIGTGLGFAVMKDGELLKNETGGPKYSIFKLPYRDKTAEDFVSGRGVLNRYNAASGAHEGSAKGVFVRAAGGDPIALRTFKETGEILSDVIRPILSELGTEALYLGGQVSKSFPFFSQALREGLHEVQTLRILEPAKDMDLVHLIGVKEWFLKERPDRAMTSPYPMKLRAPLKDIIWGGTKLGEAYHKPAGKIAEAWELAVHPEGTCVVENGWNAGRSLSDVLGTAENFPVMIKLIDAEDRLSIQVHPAKTEMWYIVDAKPGVALVYGLKDRFDENAFRKALSDGTVESLLNYVPVHPGDVFFIPQGLVHAIGAGILIAEIQENSNVTYRVYDYGRLKDGKPRELHVDAAMQTILDFTETEIEKIRFSEGAPEAGVLADCPLFKVVKKQVSGDDVISEGTPFTSVVCIKGEGRIGNEPIVQGDSYFLPEGIGDVPVSGEMDLLLTTV